MQSVKQYNILLILYQHVRANPEIKTWTEVMIKIAFIAKNSFMKQKKIKQGKKHPLKNTVFNHIDQTKMLIHRVINSRNDTFINCLSDSWNRKIMITLLDFVP